MVAQQVVGPEGLGDVGGRAGAVGLHHVRQLRPRGEEHHRDVLGVAELELAAHLVAVHARHGDVEEDEVRVAGEGELEALLAGGRGEHLVAVGGEDGGDRRGQVAVVVDHQYAESLVRHPLPPGPVCGRASVFVRPRTSPIGTVGKRMSSTAGTRPRTVHLRGGELEAREAMMKGYGPDGGARSPRIAGVTTFLRLPHVTQFDDVDVAVVGLPFDTGLAVRTGARFGPRAVREASLTIHPAYNPAQRVAVFERLSVVDAGDVRAVAGGFTDRSLAAMEATLRARCTAPARCRWASAATTRSPSPSCAPRPRSTARSRCCTSARTRTASTRAPAQRHIHSTVIRRAVEEGVDRRLALRPPRHARRARLARRVRAGARARLHRGAVGRPRAARHRRGRRGGRGDRRRARRSSPSTSTSSTRASRRPSARPRSAGRPRPRRSRSSAAAAVSTSPAPTSSRSCPSSTAATSRRRCAATIAYELLSLMACSGGTCE